MDTKKMDDDSDDSVEKSGLVLGNFLVLIVFVLLVGGVYMWVSKKNKGQTVFPAGINYLSPNSDATKTNTPVYDFAKLADSANWLTFKGKLFSFSFQYPKELKPLAFPNDPTESITFKVSDVPPELNLMFLVESVSSRDGKLVGKPEEYVKNYWKFFPGLKGVNAVESVTNDKGLTGFKASYVAKNNVITNDNYFFVMKGDDDHLLHIANIFGDEGKALFNRIVNSLEYKK